MSNSAQARRAKQTANNLLYSMLATAAVVVVMVIITPRPTQSLLQPVKYEQVAKMAAKSTGKPVLAPPLLGKGWYSNSASWNTKTSDGVDNWYLGFVGPQDQYVALTQAYGTNPTWSVFQLKGDMPAGARKIGGRTFTVWKSTTTNSPRLSHDYALVTDITTATGTDQVIVFGTAHYATLTRFAALVAHNLNLLYP